MASIRRTLSPYNDRSHQNGSSCPLLAQSPPQKLYYHGGTSLSPVRRFIAGIFFQKHHHPRKYSHFFRKKSLLRCFLFFFLGFLLGMTPFSIDLNELKQRDLRSNDFLLEINPGVTGVDRNATDLGDVEKPKEIVATIGETDMKKKLNFVPGKQLIVVTPTYNRAMQAYYMNRLGQVLRLVKPPSLWIVVEMNAASMETAEILRGIGVVHRHLVCVKNSTDVKDRGICQRNTALEHIERHRLDGIVYFADDDNIYSLELFEMIREISRFGTWPVAMVAQSKNRAILEGPVCNGSRVIGWHTNEKSRELRRFHVDMSGFAFNSTILWDPKRWHEPTSDPIRQLDSVKEGFQETTFIEQIVEDKSQMEGIPLDCFSILNWHLHLEASELAYPKGWRLQKNLDVVIPSK